MGKATGPEEEFHREGGIGPEAQGAGTQVEPHAIASEAGARQGHDPGCWEAQLQEGRAGGRSGLHAALGGRADT